MDEYFTLFVAWIALDILATVVDIYLRVRKTKSKKKVKKRT